MRKNGSKDIVGHDILLWGQQGIFGQKRPLHALSALLTYV